MDIADQLGKSQSVCLIFRRSHVLLLLQKFYQRAVAFIAIGLIKVVFHRNPPLLVNIYSSRS